MLGVTLIVLISSLCGPITASSTQATIRKDTLTKWRSNAVRDTILTDMSNRIASDTALVATKRANVHAFAIVDALCIILTPGIKIIHTPQALCIAGTILLSIGVV